MYVARIVVGLTVALLSILAAAYVYWHEKKSL